MENKIYLNQYDTYWKASEKHKKLMGSNPVYDLSKMPTEKMQEEARNFIVKRLEEKSIMTVYGERTEYHHCLLYTSPSPRDLSTSRMPSSA